MNCFTPKLFLAIITLFILMETMIGKEPNSINRFNTRKEKFNEKKNAKKKIEKEMKTDNFIKSNFFY